jgi:sugar O-acyltransferase (sialic acid O-acetyltransferase NeuD family)
MNLYGIFGAGGCGRGIMPLVRNQLRSLLDRGEADLVFVDQNPSGTNLNGHRVITYERWMAESAIKRYGCLAIANGQTRQRLAAQCVADGVEFFEVRAATVLQMDEVLLGEGAVLSPYVTLTSNIRIGRHFHANLYSYVEHDCIIGDFVTFGPGVKCNGNVVIEDYAYIGAGAVIKQGKSNAPLVIGRGAIVGMGAVVTKSVAARTTVVGNPARKIQAK